MSSVPLEAHLRATTDAHLTADGEQRFRESAQRPAELQAEMHADAADEADAADASRAERHEPPEPLEPTLIEQQVERMLADGVVLAGRRFRALGVTTFEHDAYLMQALADSKLLSTMQRFDPLHQELDDLSSAIIVECFRTGKLFALLAGVLVEDGTAWSPATAARTAAFFAALSEPVDKASLRSMIPFVLLNFFLNVDGSWRVFRTYSTSSALAAGDEKSSASANAHEPSTEAGEAQAGGPSAAPLSTTTASGISSSGPWPGSRRTATPPSLAGPSEKA